MIKNSNIKDIQLYNPFESVSSEIKLIAIDVDGVLTDGSIYVDDLGNQIKRFDSKDGIGIKLLQNYGFEIALISGSKSNSIKERGLSLNINSVMIGVTDKHIAINEIQKKLNIKASQTIFLGDDINDLTVLPAVRMFLSPKNAHPACLGKANWIGKCKGGEGFFREFTDLFLFSLNINPYLEFKSSST